MYVSYIRTMQIVRRFEEHDNYTCLFWTDVYLDRLGDYDAPHLRRANVERVVRVLRFLFCFHPLVNHNNPT